MFFKQICSQLPSGLFLPAVPAGLFLVPIAFTLHAEWKTKKEAHFQFPDVNHAAVKCRPPAGAVQLISGFSKLRVHYPGLDPGSVR